VRAILAMAVVKGLALVWLIPRSRRQTSTATTTTRCSCPGSTPSRFISGDAIRTRELSFIRYTTTELVAVVDATGVRPHMDDAIVPRQRPSFGEARRRVAERPAGFRRVVVPAAGAARGVQLPAALLRDGRRGAPRAGRLRARPVSKYYSARTGSVLLLLLTLIVAARILGDLRLPAGLGPITLFAMAFQPQLSMMSASVQPDMLALLLVTVGLRLLQPRLGALLRRHRVGLRRDARPPAAHEGARRASARARGARRAGPVRGEPRSDAGARRGRGTGRPAPPQRSSGDGGTPGHGFCSQLAGLIAWQPIPDASASLVENLQVWFRYALPMTFRSYWGVWAGSTTACRTGPCRCSQPCR